MVSNNASRKPRPGRIIKSLSSVRRPLRRASVEPLEERLLLAAAPTLDVVDEVTVQAGAPLHLALGGFDADSDPLQFSAVSEDPGLVETFVPQGNRSLRISVEGYGEMVFELFEGRAPRTTARIIELAEGGFYDDVIFHRIIEDFMIQGGDPGGDGTGGSGVEFDDEFHSELLHTATGFLSMAKGKDDSNDSQFFITSGPTRHLDFNHSVFGLLTAGDAIREQIENVPVDAETDRPLSDVVIGSTEVFVDQQNGVLMLSAPEGTSGETLVSVTVSDGADGSDTKTIRVIVEPDEEVNNSRPYLLPMADLHTSGNQPLRLSIAGIDPEGDDFFYGAWPRGNWEPFPDPELQIDLDYDSGVGFISLINADAGVHGILVGVTPLSYEEADYRTSDPNTWSPSLLGYWDFQFVPLFVDPLVPSAVELLPDSDTGDDNGDRLTNLDNAEGGSLLQFLVSGTLDGAEVSVYADGERIGQIVAEGASTVVTTDGFTAIGEGANSITARHVLPNQPVSVGNRRDTITLSSQASDPIEVTVDTSAPEFLSTPVGNAPPGERYVYDVETDDEAAAEVGYLLTQAPAGMQIDPQLGQVTWTPQPDQGPSQAVTVTATDMAGNVAQQQFDLLVNDAPQFEPIPDRQVAEGSLLTITARATDEDVPLTYSLAGTAPAGATIHPVTGLLRWTPSEAQGPGEYLINVRATDALGSASTQTVKVTVTELNTPPELQPIEDRSVDEGQLLEFTAEVTDPDLPPDSLVFTLAGNVPEGAQIDPSSGRFTFRPDETQGGNDYTIVVRVTDGLSPQDEQSFTVQVDEVQRPPVFAAVEAQFVSPGEDLAIVVRASDPDVPPQAITYSLEPGAPEGAEIDAQSGLLTWSVPEETRLRSVEISVRATEITSTGAGLSSVAMIRVNLMSIEVLAIDVAAAGPRTDQAAMAPSPVLPMTMFDSPGERPAEAFRFEFTPPASPSNGVLGSDLFGTRIGIRGGWGGFRSQQEEPPEEGEKPPLPARETPDDVDEELSGRGESPRSDRDASAVAAMADAADAAMEQLTEEQIEALLQMLAG